ncbi:MAG TPA: DUF881 domain-containing protein [Clostridia bacterium]|nr:DUF881 domain-containing protein [Clostridia bacterium]
MIRRGRSGAFFLAALFIMVAGFGYLLAVQFEPTVNNAYVVPAQNVELVEIMRGLEEENDSAAQRIVDLRRQLGELESKGAATSDEVRVLTEQLGKLREKAGLSEATSPGVVVTLSDSSRTPTLSDDPNYFVIHDGYLRSIVNLMRRYGATAIAINDQRILGDSPIICAGPIILVNSSRMSPPYVITALGDPQMLADSISQDVFFRVLEMYRDQFEITCSLEKRASLTVPASLDNAAFKFAKGAK